MARPAKYNADQILDAAAALLARQGPGATTITAIGAETGAPSGSIYHRFGSRDALLAQLWVRSVRRFQDGYLDALAREDLDGAVETAVRHVPGWCRANLAEASVLLLHRREELAAAWPGELADDLGVLAASLDGAIRSFTRRWYGSTSDPAIERVRFALIDVPYAGVRRHLAAGRPPPAATDDLLLTAARSVLALLD